MIFTIMDKETRNAYRNKWYKAHPEQRKKHLDRSNKYRAERKEYLDGLKAAPCADCGVQYPPCVMDFDHVRGEKSFTISKVHCSGIGKAKLEAELAKCDVVCSNCHRIRTQNRLTKAKQAAAIPQLMNSL